MKTKILHIAPVPEMPIKIEEFMACECCRQVRDAQEIIVNCGLCLECFEERCPCHDGKPEDCPIHKYPDVVMSFAYFD